jgi:hypothetical protein
MLYIVLIRYSHEPAIVIAESATTKQSNINQCFGLLRYARNSHRFSA